MTFHRNEERGRSSLRDLLEWARSNLNTWELQARTLSTDDLIGLDLALGQVPWHDKMDETEHLGILGAALLNGSPLREALKQYMRAKSDRQ